MEAVVKLQELDEKHNDILLQLADLEERVAKTLEEWSKIPSVDGAEHAGLPEKRTR
ncbi:MAG: hypothetical protein LBQ54_14030 [Planctomycetaceae bacterium]|jgi:hypothetical protein|nr:hypothetical protein [Planctomycetaceae bacterium]